MANHLSHLPCQYLNQFEKPIHDSFPDEQLFQISSQSTSPILPWYADVANYLVTRRIPDHWSRPDKQKKIQKVVTKTFLEAKNYPSSA